jgi:hypothetical protein
MSLSHPKTTAELSTENHHLREALEASENVRDNLNLQNSNIIHRLNAACGSGKKLDLDTICSRLRQHSRFLEGNPDLIGELDRARSTIKHQDKMLEGFTTQKEQMDQAMRTGTGGSILSPHQLMERLEKATELLAKNRELRQENQRLRQRVPNLETGSGGLSLPSTGKRPAPDALLSRGTRNEIRALDQADKDDSSDSDDD